MRAVAAFVSLSFAGCTALNASFGNGVDGETGGSTAGRTGGGTEESLGGTEESLGGTFGETSGGSTPTAESSTGSGTGSTGPSTGTTGSDTASVEPWAPGLPCLFEDDVEMPVVCYDFEGVERGVVKDRSGMSDLTLFDYNFTNAPEPWGQGLDCSLSGCRGSASGFELDDVYTIEIWMRLTELMSVSESANRLVVLSNPDDDSNAVGFSLTSGGSLDYWVRAFNREETLRVDGSQSLEYFCIALRRDKGEAPTYSSYNADGSVRVGQEVGSQFAPNFEFPILQFESGPNTLPAQIIGLRVWDRYLSVPCSAPTPP